MAFGGAKRGAAGKQQQQGHRSCERACLGTVKGLPIHMSKWTRKKYADATGSKREEEEFSPLGISLLSIAKGPSVKAIALAAAKSGCNSADLQQLAALLQV